MLPGNASYGDNRRHAVECGDYRMHQRHRSADDLLAWISHRLAAVSSAQHDLALEKTILREQATRLRLGVDAIDVESLLVRHGLRPRADESVDSDHLSELLPR